MSQGTSPIRNHPASLKVEKIVQPEFLDFTTGVLLKVGNIIKLVLFNIYYKNNIENYYFYKFKIQTQIPILTPGLPRSFNGKFRHQENQWFFLRNVAVAA